jgi:proline racemase
VGKIAARAKAKTLVLTHHRPRRDERFLQMLAEEVARDFSGRIVREASPVGGRRSVIVEVGGRAHQTGEARFRFDDDDPLREGFSLGL